MLIQGTNAPLIIEFDSNVDVIDMSIALIMGDKAIKRWGKSDVTIEGVFVYCSLTQQETIEMPTGTAVLEIKWTNRDGEVQFADRASVRIVKRIDNTILVESA